MLHSTLLIISAFTSSALALVHGVDLATLMSTAMYATAQSQGFTRAIIQGYQEACEAGGLVDPNFVTLYNNACAAGITNIDTYWVPCSAPATNANHMPTKLGRSGILLCLIPCNLVNFGLPLRRTAPSAITYILIILFRAYRSNNNTFFQWDYGPAGNLEHAQQLIVAIKDSSC